MKWTGKLVLLLAMLVCLSVGTAYAYPSDSSMFNMSSGHVYGHKDLDGNVFYLACSNKTEAFSPKYYRFTFVKKLPASGQSAGYYVAGDLKNDFFEKYPAAKVELTVNTQTVPLNIITSHAYKNYFTFGGQLPQTLAAQLPQLRDFAFTFTAPGAKSLHISLRPDNLPALGKLSQKQVTDYVREGQVYDKAEDAIKWVGQKYFYIPGATGAQIHKLFMLKTLEAAANDSTLYVRDFWKSGDPNFIDKMTGIQGSQEIDGKNSFILVKTFPYKAGQLLIPDKMMQGQTLSHQGMVSSGFGIIDMKDFWRTTYDEFDRIAFDVYHDLYGKYDTGLAWDVQAAPEHLANIFTLTKVDKTKFPVLAGLTAGDKLLKVDGVDTSFMRSIDLEYKLLDHPQPVQLEVLTKGGNKVQVTVQPAFTPAKPLPDFKFQKKLPYYVDNQDVLPYLDANEYLLQHHGQRYHGQAIGRAVRFPAAMLKINPAVHQQVTV
jgi:hypothetical protein